MSRPVLRKIMILAGILLALWAGIRYLLPLLFPFLLGLGIAAAAEPMRRFFQSRLRFPRGLSAGISVSLSLFLILALLLLTGAVLVRELGLLAGIIPNLESTVRDGLSVMESSLMNLVNKAPDGIRSVLTRSVDDLFSSSSTVLDGISSRLLHMASSALWHLPNSALTLFTAILAAFMLSAKLPEIRKWCRRKLPSRWHSYYLPAIQKIKRAIAGWLQAQVKLSGMTFLITTLGLIILRISYAPVLGFAISFVDAIPLLGTGTVLIPWSLVALLQHNQVQCIGLLGIYVTASLTRSSLEPRLVGKHLGLDPLITLIALYSGFRLWGVGGMILAPLLAVITVQLAEPQNPPLAPD